MTVTFKGESNTIFMCMYLIFFVFRYFLKTLVPKAPLGEMVGKSSCIGPSLFKLFILGFDLGTSYTRKVASNHFKAQHRKRTQCTGKRPKSSQL